jgi:hypothetical protein
MVNELERVRPEIARLCRDHHVRRLEVFGSAAEGTFDPSSSDFDFLAEFEPLGPAKLADAYFGLLEKLKRLLGRRVDLLTPGAIRNPYLRKAIDASRQTLYAA